MNNENNEEKVFITFEEMMSNYDKSPKDSFLWSGIKEKSFGLIFGPSKSGKTIFCENLAMKIASGAESFFGHNLPGNPQKVLINENYRYQTLDFPRHVVDNETWERLEGLIEQSEAEVVFIDSITRLNHGRLEDSKTAEEILSRLREMCYRQAVTLVCIHHTPKMNGKPLTMDSIKGSAVFAQESDFAIGVNKTNFGNRYLKNVFFRYAPDDDDQVKEMIIDENIWLQFTCDVEEQTLFQMRDGRENPEVKDFIVEFFNSTADTTHETSQVVEHFRKNLGLQERQIKSHLSNLVDLGKIDRPQRGYYASTTAKSKIMRGGADV